MLEKVDEPIEVLAKFADKPDILAIKWRGQKYWIQRQTLAYSEGRGADRVCYFSLSDSTNNFTIAWHTGKLSWRLIELYYDS